MRALAVTSLARAKAAPDIPTIAENGFAGFSADAWSGLFAPKGTPTPIIDKLYAEVARILKTQAVQDRFAPLGLHANGTTPAEYTAFLKAEIEKWAQFV